LSTVNFEEVFKEIEELNLLEVNWDGEDALKPLPETIKNSLNAAKLLEFSVIMAPDITPENYGTVSFEWDNSYGLIHLEIGKTKYAMFASDKSKTTKTLFFDGDTENMEADMPQIVLAINNKLKRN
jgi:hypothetical protein